MRWRLFPSVLLLFASSFLAAQNVPDFSGVYLQNPKKTGLRPGKNSTVQHIQALEEVEQAFEGPPLILVVTQKSDAIETTKIQNGTQDIGYYRLTSSNSKKARLDSVGRAKLKNRTLLIEYTANRPFEELPLLPTIEKIEEKWELSPDASLLTIRRSISPFSVSELDTFVRQASLDSALARASEVSLVNKCVCLRLPFPANARTKDWDEAELGFTVYRQLNTCVLFDAGLWGGFFKGLERSETPNGTQFRKSGQVVSEFPSDGVLEVTVKVHDCPQETFSALSMITSPSTLPPELLGLRFRVKWTGSATRDLGEVESELLSEPWPELRPAEKFFRMQIPSKDVRLTDTLEVRILTKTGNQVGCIKGRI